MMPFVHPFIQSGKVVKYRYQPQVAIIEINFTHLPECCILGVTSECPKLYGRSMDYEIKTKIMHQQ